MNTAPANHTHTSLEGNMDTITTDITTTESQARVLAGLNWATASQDTASGVILLTTADGREYLVERNGDWDEVA
jgi:hypothetical protein